MMPTSETSDDRTCSMLKAEPGSRLATESIVVDSTCTLLELPPELRTIIYEYALLEPDLIRVSRSNLVVPPSLLATCRQVRSEAIKIYHSENKFSINAPDCDVDLYIKWHNHFSQYWAKQASWALGINLSGRASWTGLMKWLEWAFKRNSCAQFTPASLQKSDGVRRVTISAHRICARAKQAGRLWEDVKEDLDDFHAALAAANADWA